MLNVPFLFLYCCYFSLLQIIKGRFVLFLTFLVLCYVFLLETPPTGIEER